MKDKIEKYIQEIMMTITKLVFVKNFSIILETPPLSVYLFTYFNTKCLEKKFHDITVHIKFWGITSLT